MIYKHIIDKGLSLASRAVASRCKHSAILYDSKGNIIGAAFNDAMNKNATAAMFYEQKAWHSEGLLLYRNRKKLHLYDGSLFMLSLRTNREGVIRNAKPCEECMVILNKYPQIQIYYSNENGEIIKL